MSLFGFLEGNSTRTRLMLDRLARRVVSLGGVVIIFSILAIFLVIVAEVYPLFKKAEVSLKDSFSLPNEKSPLGIGVDEHREVAYVVQPSGIQFYSLKTKKPVGNLSGLNGVVSGVSGIRDNFLMLGLSNGLVLPVRVRFNVTYAEDVRSIEPAWEAGEPLVINPNGEPVSLLTSTSGEQGYTVAAVSANDKVTVVTVQERKTMMGTTVKKEFRKTLSLPAKGEITALLMQGEKHLVAGTASGQILHVTFGASDTKEVQFDTLGATRRQGIGVSVLGFLVGNQTLIVGDEEGEVNSYHLFKGEDDRFRIKNVYRFALHEQPVVTFYSSTRDKGFITGDAGGVIRYHFATTGKTQYTVHGEGKGRLVNAVLTPKTDGILALDDAGSITHWAVANPHPEVSGRSLFGKLLYEGYPEAEYVWQSTGGSDDFEPKLSLAPLIYGTLKGTFYALLFAIPVALFAALYTSQFMHPQYRNIVKPVIEIMAGLPSVVLGFFAALWLAPKVEKVLPGLMISPLVLIMLVSFAFIVYQYLPPSLKTNRKPGSEIFILILLVALVASVSFCLGGILESALLGGDYRVWLREKIDISYDQRNSMVVGLAMGFAVIPIIFTISEDSLSNVPPHLSAASLALGATRWQTAINVILPTASPGIFSAIMIGFGRAVGETMIVLMATGNTPVMDLSPFDGFRALSANIAVELPEAPEGGTLFRVLFLAALLLFAMTFAVNTAAEWVRLRLRERYRVL